MTTAIKRRRGTTTQHSTFTGLDGEITIDTTKKTVVVHDGSTAGGTPLAKESAATSAVAITGGTINGTTIGATTASTGAFSTLSASGVATFSAGTVSLPAITTTGDTNTGIYFPAADTIAFTEGGAEAMRINSSGNVFIGTATSSGERLRVETATNTYLSIIAGTTSVSQLWFGDTADANIGLIGYDHSTNAMLFRTNNTEAIRITSAGLVGIGTSSPEYPLDVQNSSATRQARFYRGAASTSAILIQNSATGTTSSDGLMVGVNSSGEAIFNNQENLASIFYTNDTERMRIDSTGNLGLGVTPSAWGSQYKAMQIGTAGATYANTNANTVGLTCNYYGATSTDVYLTTGFATRYYQFNGQHIWNTAASGTAGNAITFTQAMTLNASGNLGIGTSSPSQKLQVVGNALISNGGWFGFGDADERISADNTGFMQFFVNASERIRIDSSGNVGIATTSPTQKLQVAGNVLAANAGWFGFGDADERIVGDNTGSMQFFVSGSERMRIDSSGNLLIGRTSGTGAMIDAFNASSTSGVIRLRNDTGGGQVFARFDYGGTIIGSISGNNTVTAYNVTSDARVKTNIVDAPSGNINDIKVRSFDWKADGSHQEYGVIAQELVTVAPYAVHQPQDAEEMMAVDYSKLVPMMIKEIQDLKQRIATLENK
jgi:hypothetical protein